MKVTSISSLCTVICGLLVVIGWSVAEAQAQQRGRGMGGGMGVTRLLGIQQVQKEVNITAEQKTKLEKMREGSRQPRLSREEWQKQQEELQNLSEEERQKRMESMEKERREQAAKRTQETMKKLAEILKPEQLMRVKQIQMQLEGVAALRRPEVIKHIGLDDAQKAQLQKINEGALEQMRELWSGRNRGGDDANRDQSRQQMREKMQKSRKEIEKKVMAVLNPEQKKKLGEMMGKQFELDRSAFGRRGDGRRGEGRQGRRGQSNRGGQNSSNNN